MTPVWKNILQLMLLGECAASVAKTFLESDVAVIDIKQPEPVAAGIRQAVQPQVNFQGSKGNINLETLFPLKDKVVIVMGATGTGLDIATNKVTEEECKGIPHHLLGVVEPGSNFTAKDFRIHAAKAVESIVSRDRLPIIAGKRYDCCFLWVDVSLPVLYSFVSERVDEVKEF
ncbi:hypothetical protein LWI29_037443 [Acer saccharum]|uniref:Uncharacterized protein n=1 Tax=Acer saccharum TaxID=4024 RepID=A0AA39TBU5_ACESA|nr:hypothetical protein LWI29_037443 [Acer saccharum]